jgi:osmotically-inducible protein OsmY
MKSDEALWQDVEQSLRWEGSIDAGQIRVHVRDGIVTLTGTVPNLLQKQIVEKTVQDVAGCRALVMELSLPPASPYIKSDELLASRIVAALARMPGLPAERMHVETERGCVMLSGSVDTDAQRREIASLVGRIDGVVGVSNRLTVCELPVEDVGVRIGMTLDGRLRSNVDNIRVDSSDGVVTLSGNVGSLDEKRAACLAASKVKGVREVIDRLTVL